MRTRVRRAPLTRTCVSNRSVCFALLFPPSQNDLQVLTKRLSQLQAESERKKANLQEYDRTVQETEAAYMKILESSQTLLHVLKRETVSLSKKTGSRPGQMQLMG